MTITEAKVTLSVGGVAGSKSYIGGVIEASRKLFLLLLPLLPPLTSPSPLL